MNKDKLFYLRRLSVLIILLLIFKQGDLTFTSAFEPSLRSLLFSVYFILYWMLFWGICSSVFNKFMEQVTEKRSWYRKLSIVSIVLLCFAVVSALIFNWGYFTMDHFCFGISWKEDVHFINPEIFEPSDYFETININPELLFGFILFFLLVYGTHIFITSFKNVKELELIAARQKKESITAQYAALKNQIDPHFFFNSLSVLSSLIYESTELSAAYVSHLSKHYRYILDMQTDNLVTVDKELEHLESYFFLMKIRHPDCISFTVNLDRHTQLKCKVLPHSLQMLIENAIKHNTFKKENPLVIEIFEEDDYLVVRNNLNKRKLLYESTGIGLQNIRGRYAIESNKDVFIEESDHFFVVKLPKLS